jgi:hypothetical protein
VHIEIQIEMPSIRYTHIKPQTNKQIAENPSFDARAQNIAHRSSTCKYLLEKESWMARLLFANSQRGRSSNIWNFSRGNIWKYFAASQSSLFPTERTRRRIFQIYQYDPLSFEERTHNKIGRIAGAVIPRIGYLVATLHFTTGKKIPFSSLARWKESLPDYIVKPTRHF